MIDNFNQLTNSFTFYIEINYNRVDVLLYILHITGYVFFSLRQRLIKYYFTMS